MMEPWIELLVVPSYPNAAEPATRVLHVTLTELGSVTSISSTSAREIHASVLSSRKIAAG